MPNSFSACEHPNAKSGSGNNRKNQKNAPRCWTRISVCSASREDSETGSQPHREAASRADCITRKQSAEIDHVQNICQVLAVHLEANLHALRLIDIGSCRGAEQRRRKYPPARKINAADYLRAVLCQRLLLCALKIEWQPAAILHAACDPKSRFDLVRPAREQRIALVLRVGKVSRELRQRRLSIVADEQSARDRIPRIAHHVGVAGETGDLMPSRYRDLSFRAVDDRLAKRDGKADRRVVDLIVVGIISHVAQVVVRVDAQIAAERLRHARFVIVALRRYHRQLNDIGIDQVNLERTRKQQVLERRRLEDAVIREVREQSELREVARDGNPRIDRLLVDDQLIVVPAQAKIQRPVSQANQVLHKRRLLQVLARTLIRVSSGEVEGQRRPGIELRRIGDVVIEVLVQEGIVRLDPDLPLVAPLVDA